MEKFYKHIFVLTGAGISAESGLATFRDASGLWNNHKVEDVATIEAFEKNPQYVHEFYNELRPLVFSAQPNLAHYCLARLQKEYKEKVNIITQNVDTFHEKAGSENVYHIHGRIELRNYLYFQYQVYVYHLYAKYIFYRIHLEILFRYLLNIYLCFQMH